MFHDLSYRAGKLYRNNKEVGWFNKSNGYRMFQYKGKKYLTHRIIWYLCKGRWPKYHIDHIDQDRINNTIKNLRDVRRSTNLHNVRQCNKDNTTSKVRGVHRHSQNPKWIAQITVKGRIKHLGSFDTIQEAQVAYLAAKVQIEE